MSDSEQQESLLRALPSCVWSPILKNEQQELSPNQYEVRLSPLALARTAQEASTAPSTPFTVLVNLVGVARDERVAFRLQGQGRLLDNQCTCKSATSSSQLWQVAVESCYPNCIIAVRCRIIRKPSESTPTVTGSSSSRVWRESWRPLLLLQDHLVAEELNKLKAIRPRPYFLDQALPSAATAGEESLLHFVLDLGRFLDFVTAVLRGSVAPAAVDDPAETAGSVDASAGSSGGARTNKPPGSEKYYAALLGCVPRHVLYKTGVSLFATSIRHGLLHTSTFLMATFLRMGGTMDWLVEMACEGGSTLLHLAAESASQHMVATVMKWGQEYGHALKWDAKDRQGVTPLHLAAALEDGGSLALSVLTHNSSACRQWSYLEDAQGNTPAEISRRRGRHDLNDVVAHLLRQLESPLSSREPQWTLGNCPIPTHHLAGAQAAMPQPLQLAATNAGEAQHGAHATAGSSGDEAGAGTGAGGAHAQPLVSPRPPGLFGHPTTSHLQTVEESQAETEAEASGSELLLSHAEGAAHASASGRHAAASPSEVAPDLLQACVHGFQPVALESRFESFQRATPTRNAPLVLAVLAGLQLLAAGSTMGGQPRQLFAAVLLFLTQSGVACAMLLRPEWAQPRRVQLTALPEMLRLLLMLLACGGLLPCPIPSSWLLPGASQLLTCTTLLPLLWAPLRLAFPALAMAFTLEALAVMRLSQGLVEGLGRLALSGMCTASWALALECSARGRNGRSRSS